MRNERREIPLQVLPGETSSAIRATGSPVFIGDAGVDYVCGSCGTPLCVGMREGALAGIAFTCACGATNRVPWPPERTAADERETSAASRPHRGAAGSRPRAPRP
jgi:hypothetical protein